MANDVTAETHVSGEGIQGLIREVRGQRGILDDTLGAFYGVLTKHLNEQVNRSEEWFRNDFMFRLSNEVWEALKSQIATARPCRFGSHPMCACHGDNTVWTVVS